MPGDESPEIKQSMSLLDHFVELRQRLINASLGVSLGMLVGMFLVLGPPQLVDYIIATFLPTDKGYPPVQGVGTAETFTSYMSVALVVGIILGMPGIVYQVIAFVVPGLTADEKRFLFKALPFVTLFFAVGLLFGWMLTVPVALRFLTGFGNPELIANQPSLSDFLEKVTLLLLMNGIVFELPVIIYILAWLGVVTPQQLGSYRRYAVVIVAIVAAVITPTGDPINLMLLAVPMYFLFELGLVLARFVPQQKS